MKNNLSNESLFGEGKTFLASWTTFNFAECEGPLFCMSIIFSLSLLIVICITQHVDTEKDSMDKEVLRKMAAKTIHTNKQDRYNEQWRSWRT